VQPVIKTVASTGSVAPVGEHGAMRQSPAGISIYGDAGTTEVPLPETRSAYAPEFDDLSNALVHGKPVRHDGRWSLATLEVCWRSYRRRWHTGTAPCSIKLRSLMVHSCSQANTESRGKNYAEHTS
jgi:hypothetical protein